MSRRDPTAVGQPASDPLRSGRWDARRSSRRSSWRPSGAHRFAAGTNLLQIAIVLETVAAVLDRPALWRGGIAVGTLALADGFLGLV